MKSKTSVPIWQVDAFTDRPFSGNPAAVCLLETFADADWMQALAAEMNLSETAFVVPRGSPNEFDLRWFTPATEVDLCGHATLASAWIISQQPGCSQDLPFRFHTRSGWLTCRVDDDEIQMDFPATPPDQPVEAGDYPGLDEALGFPVTTQSVYLGKTIYDLFIVLESAEQVRQLRPNFHKLGMIGVRGLTITAESPDEGVDFESRFFAPGSGINEDPVTGSAHCALGVYWAEQMGRDGLLGRQGGLRQGRVRTHRSGDRMLLSGQAVTVWSGTLQMN